MPDSPRLADLEHRVDQALATGDETGIEILGYGEISCVLAWHDGSQALAAKRLPLFDSQACFNSYRDAFNEYLGALGEAGIEVVSSRIETTPATDGRVAVWCLQPLLDSALLGPTWLHRAGAPEAQWLFERITEHVAQAVGPRLGLDGQLSNWAATGDGVVYFDVTTPMMRDARGTERLDTDLFLASLPSILRGLVRRFMLGSILDKYYSPRGVLVDLLGNLIKEGVPEHLPLGIEIVNQMIEDPVDRAEVTRYYREDAAMWALLQRLRRLDRAWQRKVRRRQYPFLLPGKVDRHV